MQNSKNSNTVYLGTVRGMKERRRRREAPLGKGHWKQIHGECHVNQGRGHFKERPSMVKGIETWKGLSRPWDGR